MFLLLFHILCCTDCTGNGKSNYHMTITAPPIEMKEISLHHFKEAGLPLFSIYVLVDIKNNSTLYHNAVF
jgi:hypothetical protein